MWKQLSANHPRPFAILKHGLFPAAFYFVSFSLLTWPLMGLFFSRFFADDIDGFQNVWNIWWVNQAVRDPALYPSIWHTSLLHWPYGTTLLGHTLNPFNGYLGSLLLSFVSLRTAYNTIIVFAFVMGGLTMHWLACYLTRAYWPSLAAGFLFTFSAYHFAHGGNQLQTASLEWIPLFLLCWYVLLTRPGLRIGLATAVVLELVILCDYYYFTYCILAAAILLIWCVLENRSLRIVVERKRLLSLGLFVAAALVLTGPLVANLLITNSHDPFVGAHDAATYSLDLPAIVIPGGSWLFNQWTQSYWQWLPGNPVENSVFLGLPVFFLVGYLWFARRSLDPAAKAQLYLWSCLALFFFLMALGPALRVMGNVVWDRFMPYTLLGAVLPFLSISGVPARMTVMVVLSTALLSAFALRELPWTRPRTRLLTLGLVALMLFETLPAPLPASSASVPPWATALAALPNNGGVLIEVKARMGLQLYYQTVYDKPMAFGYLARIPARVAAQDEQLSATIQANDFTKLWNTYHIRYIVSSDPLHADSLQPPLTLATVYQEKGIRIYRLGCTCEPEH